MKINLKYFEFFLLLFVFLSFVPPLVLAQSGEGNDAGALLLSEERGLRRERDVIIEFPSRLLETEKTQSITTITFAGDVPAANDKQIIIQELRNAVRTMSDDSLYLVEYAPSWRYNFTFTIKNNRLSSAQLQVGVTVAFSQGDRVLCESETYIITAANETMTASRIAERIRGDKEFFNKINKLLE